MKPPKPETMVRMLADLRGCLHAPVGFADRLPTLLDALRDCRFGLPQAKGKALRPDPDALGGMLTELNESMSAIEAAGNPWTAAGLRRDEVRNSSVLAWLLAPKGGHGLGDALLRSVLARVGQKLPFPDAASRACVVTVEDCPDGSRDSRVDVTIDDPGRFFLGIEVKIDAPEQSEQVERYCRVAQARACDGRPWSVVFLTPTGRMPATAGDGAASVVPVSWSDIAAALRTIAAASRRDARKGAANNLAKTFAAHISRF